MNKFLFVFFIIFSHNLYAAGPYDGIWKITGGKSFITIQESNFIVIMTVLDVDESWEAYLGERDEDVASLVSIVGNGTVGMELQYLTNKDAVLEILYCTPKEGFECKFEPPVTLSLRKVF